MQTNSSMIAKNSHAFGEFDLLDIFDDIEDESPEISEDDPIYSLVQEMQSACPDNETSVQPENTKPTEITGDTNSPSAALAKIRELETEIRFDKIPADNTYAVERKLAGKGKATKVHQNFTKKTHRKKRWMLDVLGDAATLAQAQHKTDFSIYVSNTDTSPLPPALLSQFIQPEVKLPAYRELPERVQPCLFNVALANTQNESLKLYPFTFNLSAQVVANPKFQANPTGYLKDRLLKNLKAKLNREVLFWFTLETGSQFGFPYIRPHCHGAILLTEKELEQARIAIFSINGIRKKIAAVKKLSKKHDFQLSDVTQRASDFTKYELRFDRGDYQKSIETSGDVFATLNWPLYSTKYWTSDSLQWLGKKAHCTASESLKRLARDYYNRLRDEHKQRRLTGELLH